MYDDGVYVAAGALLARGHLPYRDFVLVHPPGSTYLIALVGLVVRQPAQLFLTLRWLMVAVGVVNILLVGALATRHAGRLEGAFAAGVYAVLPEAVHAEHTVILEPLLNTACLAAIGLWLALDPSTPPGSRRQGWRAVLCGLVLSVGLTAKLWAALAAVACLAVPPDRDAARRRLELAAGVVGGLVLLWGPLLLLAPRPMLDEVIGFQLHRPADGVAGALARLHRMAWPQEVVAAGLLRGLFVVAVVVLGVTGAVRRPGRFERLVAVWFALLVASFLVASTWWEQYDAHLAAAFALLSAVALGSARRWLHAVSPAPALGLAAAGLVLTAGFAADSLAYRPERNDDLPSVSADVAREVPSGSCLVSLEPGWLVAAGRLPAVGGADRFAVDPYASLLLGAGSGRSLQDIFGDASRQADLTAAIETCPYLLASDYRSELILSAELRAWIGANFESLSSPAAGVELLRRR